jgi:hypothetical protein
MLGNEEAETATRTLVGKLLGRPKMQNNIISMELHESTAPYDYLAVLLRKSISQDPELR